MVTPILAPVPSILARSTLGLTQHPQPWLSQHWTWWPHKTTGEPGTLGLPGLSSPIWRGVGKGKAGEEEWWVNTSSYLVRPSPCNESINALTSRTGERDEVKETEAWKAWGTSQSRRYSRRPGPHLNPTLSGSRVCVANRESIRPPKPQRPAEAEQVRWANASSGCYGELAGSAPSIQLALIQLQLTADTWEYGPRAVKSSDFFPESQNPDFFIWNTLVCEHYLVKIYLIGCSVDQTRHTYLHFAWIHSINT